MSSTPDSKVDYKSSGHFEGGDARNVLGAEPYGVVKAIDPATGNLRWEFKEQTYSYASVLSTAGGLVFSGTRDGYCFALDDATGQPLWRFQTGGPVYGSAITFLVNGKQCVALAAGQGFFLFGL